MSRRTWSPAKFGPPGPSVAAVCGPPVPQSVPPPSFAYLARQREATAACNFVALLCCKVTVCKLRPTVASYFNRTSSISANACTHARARATNKVPRTTPLIYSGLASSGAQLYKSCIFIMKCRQTLQMQLPKVQRNAGGQARACQIEGERQA